DLQPLFDEILKAIPGPAANPDGNLQTLVANIDYNDYVGRLSIGRIFSDSVKIGDQISICRLDGSVDNTKVSKLYAFDRLKQTPGEWAHAGEIIALAGYENISIGETISSADNPEPLPTNTVDEPTISMIFGVNTSPFAGREGKYVTSRKIAERL